MPIIYRSSLNSPQEPVPLPVIVEVVPHTLTFETLHAGLKNSYLERSSCVLSPLLEYHTTLKVERRSQYVRNNESCEIFGETTYAVPTSPARFFLGGGYRGTDANHSSLVNAAIAEKLGRDP